MTIISNRFEMGSYLLENGDFITKYPSCSYIVRQTLDTLQKFEAQEKDNAVISVVSRFRLFIEEIWNSFSSAISETIEISSQSDLIRKLGEYLKEIGNILQIEDSSQMIISFETKIGLLRNDFQAFGEDNLKLAAKKPPFIKRVENGKPLRFWEGIEPWKRSLVNLIAEYGLLRKNNVPSFLLRSGHRSFYLFNISFLVCVPEIAQKFGQVFERFIDDVKQKIVKKEPRKITLVFMSKAYGEAPGTVMLAFKGAEIESSVVDLPPRPHYDFLDWLRGPAIDKDVLLLPFDDVLTTGEGARRNIERIESNSSSKLVAYLVVFDRSPRGVKELNGVAIYSMINREEMINAELWVPEILMVPFETEWHFWAGLDLHHVDYLKEICLYTNRQERYYKLVSKFEGIFKFYDPNLVSDSEVTTYLRNLHLIIWGTYYWDFIRRLQIGYSRLDELIEAAINFEVRKKGIAVTLSEFINEAFRKRRDKERDFSLQEWLHRFVVEKSNELSHLFMDVSPKFINLREQFLKMTLQESIEKMKLEGKVLQGQAEEYEKQGQHEKAFLTYLKAIKVDPALLLLGLKYPSEEFIPRYVNPGDFRKNLRKDIEKRLEKYAEK